jgi:hypothetical protein
MDRDKSLEAHEVRNQRLLGVFVEKQTNLGELRLIEFHFWVSGQESASKLGLELQQNGFKLIRLNPAPYQDYPDRWNVEVSITASIATAMSQGFTATLHDLAARLDAEYDGWGTSI